MARIPFIAGNWKLNLGPAAAASHGTALKEALASRGDVQVAVFPTALSLAHTLPSLAGSGIGVGVQDVAVKPSGAFTGCNSAVMAREMGCEFALIGHSERRQLFGETDQQVHAKVREVLAAGLLPIVCLGETLEERQAGHVDTVVHRQLAGAVDGLTHDELSTLTLAYEPVWAIGTGVVASPDQAQEVHASLRGWLRAHYPEHIGSEMRIQYGGSVKPTNAAALLSCPDIDGALVGGASLDASRFTEIVTAAR
jgi:triosephosphate isomerase (TIM)